MYSHACRLFEATSYRATRACSFLGFAFLTESPFRFEVESTCTTTYTRTRLVQLDYPVEQGWYDFDNEVNECRRYPFGALIEYAGAPLCFSN